MARLWTRSLWVATAAFLVATCAPPPGPPVVTTTTSQTAGLTVVAAGDIACDPKDSFFNGGLGDATHCQMNATAQDRDLAPPVCGTCPGGHPVQRRHDG